MAARSAFLFAVLMLAACARSEDASILAEDNDQARTVEHVRTPEQDDEAVALGEWRASVQDDANVLEFGPAGATPVFSLRCDGRRGLFLQRHGAAAAGDLPTMLLTMGSETRRLAVAAVSGATPLLRAGIMPQDPLLDQLARNAGPIVIRVGDSPPLVLPPAPAIATYVNGCESVRADGDVPDGAVNVAVPAPIAVNAVTTPPAPAVRNGQ